MKKTVELTEGSTYLVRSMGTRDEYLETTGLFKGYMHLGEMSAIVMELGDDHGDESGLVRLVPTHFILSLDIKDQKEKEEEKKKAADPHFYG